MATKGTAQFVLVDEFDFSGDTSSIGTTIGIAELDGTDLDSTAMEYVSGLPTWRIVQNGYFAGGDADGIADELHDRLGTTGAVVSHVIDGATPLSPSYTILDAFNAALPIEAPATELITMSGEWAASESGTRGLVLSWKVTFTGASNKPSQDFGSAGSDGGTFILHVHSIDGDASGTSTGSAIRIQSSANDIDYDDEGEISFSATGGFSVALSGTVNRYWRIYVSGTGSMGGASSINVTAIVAVNGVTQ